MKIKIILIVSSLISINILSQNSPLSYKIGNEISSVNKITSSNPLSNSITDIITIGDTIWLGTSRGVSLSTDGGQNWTNFFGQSDFGTDNISAIAYNNGVFWCATAKSTEVTGGQTLPEGTGLKYTSNLGTSWTSIPQPLDLETDTLEQYGNNLIRALPVTVAIQNLAYDIAFTPGTIWIATFAGGLRKSTDNGQSWKRVILPPDNLDSISPSDTLEFCLSPVDGNFCGSGNLNHRVFSVIAISPNTLYVGTANGVNKSTDGGISWVKFNHQNQSQPISGNFITALGYNGSNSTVWVSSWRAEDQSEFYGVSSSSDGGQTWNTFLQDERPHNFGFKNMDIMVPTDNGVFRSTDKGATWLLPNSIVDAKSKASIKTNVFYSAASNDDKIWLGSDDGLAKLQETAGKTWEGEWTIYFASQSLKSELETYCYPNPFSPRQEELKIKFSTGGKDANVTIRVFDFGFNYVRTIIQNVTRNRDLEGAPEFWDGKDDSGNFVPNGVYFYRIEVGDSDPIFGKILVIQ
jgi:ligand-binding sensor domain-containing protein